MVDLPNLGTQHVFILTELCFHCRGIIGLSTQTQVLYKKAVQAAALTGREHVIDAYCGIGTIGMCMSAKAMHVTGIELNAQAVKDAKANAKRNNIKNMHFVAADATEYMTRMSQKGERADVIVMDPPRSGSTEAFVRAVVSLKPSRIVYVSCEPETLGSDGVVSVPKGPGPGCGAGALCVTSASLRTASFRTGTISRYLSYKPRKSSTPPSPSPMS